jgi:hypothetical protein
MKKIIAAALLFSAAFAAPAFAANTPFYAGVAVGNGFGIMGGYQIDKILSVEADYISYNSNSSFTNCGYYNCGNYTNASSFGVFGVGKFPLNLKGASGLSVFGRVGVVRTAWNSSNAGYYYSNSEITLGFGGGAQYDFNETVSARLGLSFNSSYSNDLYIGALLRF